MSLSDSVETELLTGTPRPVRFRPWPLIGRIMLWISTIGLALLICALAANDLTDLKALMKDGKQGLATVTGKHYSSGRSTTYYLKYQYEVGGRVFTGDESVSWSQYSDATFGTALPILYLPSSPEIHRFPPVDNARITRATVMWSLGFLFFVGMLAICLFICEKAFRTQYRLLRFGEPIQAEITRCVPPAKGAKSRLYSVGYRFQAPMYGAQEGTALVSIKLGQWLSQQSHVTVLIDPQKIQTSRMYAALNTVELSHAQRSIPRF